MDELKASRELDARIAVEVMGWTEGDRGYWDHTGDASDYRQCEWSPSTDIAAAYQVESRIAELGLEREYMAALWDIAYNMNPSLEDYRGDFLYKHASPEMICQAALQAMAASQ